MYKSSILRALSVILALVLCFSGIIVTNADETKKTNGDDAIMATAASQLGYKEGADEYTKYGEYFQYQGPWCGAFISWCARSTGISEDIIPTILSSESMYAHYKAEGLFHYSKSYGGNYIPKKGDIAFFTSTNTYQRSKDNITHVGLVLEANSSSLTLIEGNCPDRVRQIDRKYTSYVVGFATPRYEGINPDGTEVSPTYKAGKYVTNEVMNFRKTPGSTVITTIPAGTTLQITAIEGVWGKTEYEGKKGWLSLEYSTYKPAKTEKPPTTEAPAVTPSVTPVAPSSNKQYRVTADMNIRAKANESSKIIGGVPAGTLIEVLEVTDDNWGKIHYKDVTGWMSLNWSVEYNPEIDWLVIDVSYSQYPDDIDWMELKSQGVRGAIIRIGGRGSARGRKIYSDQYFLEHYKAAKAADMHVGVYFFSYALTKKEAIEEAQYTLDILKINDCQLDLPVYIDMEDFGSDKSHLNAGRKVCSMVLDEFCKVIEDAGYMAGIYCSSSFADTHVDPKVFKGRSAWIAEWGPDVCCYNGRVDMWQYTENGKLDGTSNKKVDLNRLYVDYPSIINGEKFANGLLEPGDLDFDGKVTAADSRLALRFAVSFDKPTALQKSIGDVDKNGKINSADAREILIKATA